MWMVFGKWLNADAYQYPPQSASRHATEEAYTLQANTMQTSEQGAATTVPKVHDVLGHHTSKDIKTDAGTLPLPLQQGMTLYKQGEWQACYTTLQAWLSGQSQDEAQASLPLVKALAQYYKGLSAMTLGYYQEATTALQEAQTLLRQTPRGASMPKALPTQGLERFQGYIESTLKLLSNTSQDTFSHPWQATLHALDAPPKALPKVSVPALPPTTSTTPQALGTAAISPEQQAQLMQQYQLQQLMGILGNTKGTSSNTSDPLSLMMMLQGTQGQGGNGMGNAQSLDPQMVQTLLQNQMLNGMELFSNDTDKDR